jgi:hypothetical protein
VPANDPKGRVVALRAPGAGRSAQGTRRIRRFRGRYGARSRLYKGERTRRRRGYLQPPILKFLPEPVIEAVLDA